jgi:hypothetical protein
MEWKEKLSQERRKKSEGTLIINMARVIFEHKGGKYRCSRNMDSNFVRLSLANANFSYRSNLRLCSETAFLRMSLKIFISVYLFCVEQLGPRTSNLESFLHWLFAAKEKTTTSG